MKKSILILFCLIISCVYLFQLENDKKLPEKIETELNSKNKTVDFEEIIDFDWNSLIILGPYTTIENVEEEFNLNLANIRQNGIHYSDYYDLLVFLKEKKSVKIAEFNRRFSSNSHRKIIKKEKSKFKTGDDRIINLIE